MFWTYLVGLGDFRRGEQLVLVDIMQTLLDSSEGLSIEEQRYFMWQWTTECRCERCQRFSANVKTGLLVQLAANTLQQSCVDITELFYHHFGGAP